MWFNRYKNAFLWLFFLAGCSLFFGFNSADTGKVLAFDQKNKILFSDASETFQYFFPIINGSEATQTPTQTVTSTTTPTVTPTPTATPTVTSSPTTTTTPPTPVGPIGGTFTSIVMDPNQNDNIYVGHYGSGVYKSYDQGNTWYAKSNGLQNLFIYSLATHPFDSSIVYAGTHSGGLYKSTNAGESWFQSSGGLLDHNVIYDIEIDPKNPNVIYAASRAPQVDTLYGVVAKSVDAGLSWSVIFSAANLDSLDYFYDIDVNPLNSNELILSTHTHGYFKSVNAGASFYGINQGVTDYSARTTAMDPAYAGLVYGGVWHGMGVYQSWNGGTYWTRTASGLPSDVEIYRLTLDPFGRTAKKVFACTYGDGLFASENFGGTWFSEGLEGKALYDFAIADGNPQRWYAATENYGLYRSSSYGDSWNAITADLSLGNITGVVRASGEGNFVYASVYGQGVYRLEQNASDWVPVNSGLTDTKINRLLISNGQVFALTESNLFFLLDQMWIPVGLPAKYVSLRKVYLDWVNERVSIPEEVQLNSSTTWGREILSDFDVQSVSATDVIATQAGFLIGTAGEGLWFFGHERWEFVGLDGYLIQSMILEPETENIWVSACDAEHKCTLLYGNGQKWLNRESGLVGLRVNQFVSANGQLLAASDQGIYGWDEKAKTWMIKGAEGTKTLAISSAAEDACLMAAAAEKAVFVSRDCGSSWSSSDSGLEFWQYQAVDFLNINEPVLVVGSKEAGLYIINLE